MNVNGVGATERAGRTVSVTGTSWNPFAVSVAVIRITALYVPALSAPGATDALNVAGVVPLPGATDSHVATGLAATAAVTGTGLPPLETLKGCEAGVGPLILYVNVSAVGAIVSAGSTVRLTGILIGLFVAKPLTTTAPE